MAEPEVQGVPSIEIKEEPVDSVLETVDNPIIPKEYLLSNGVHEDSDCEDTSYFTQLEVDNTRKCLENTRLIIKDFETQLDWHLQQYMTLRNVFGSKKNGKNGKDDNSRRQDLLSISQLSALIASHPEGNKNFIRRKGPSKGPGRKRRRTKGKETDESETSDESDEFMEEFEDSEGMDDPDEEDEEEEVVVKKSKTRGKKGKPDVTVHVKDEIEEEEHELVEPKVERQSDEEMDEEMALSPPKQPTKRGRPPKDSLPSPKKGRGRPKKMDTVDLSNLKTCKVVLNRLQADEFVEVKDEDIDRDELIEMLQSKVITSLEEFLIDSDKQIVILNNENVGNFDFNECNTSNVIVTFENSNTLPEFVFVQNVAKKILDGAIKLVLASVFDEHLAEN